MAALVDHKEAARLLGISEDALTSMLSRNEIFGYRDGTEWKFKMQELERVADERGVQLGGEAPEPGGSGIDAELDELHEVVGEEEETAEGESMLISEEELGQSTGESTASTIIGKEDSGEDREDSDIKLADSVAAEGASDVLTSGKPGSGISGDSGSGKGSDVELVPGESGSDLEVVADSGLSLEDEDTSAGDTQKAEPMDVEPDEEAPDESLDTDKLEGDESLAIDDELATDGSGSGDDDSLLGSGDSGADSLALDSGDSLAIDDDDSMSLEGTSDSLSLDEDYDDDAPTQLGSSEGAGDSVLSDDDEDMILADSVALSGSDLEKADEGGSAVALGEDDDDDLVLGSGAGSDVTLGAGDSGIGLSTPTDSGLSLEEEPVELGGSQVDAMALGEDDMIELDEEETDPEAATQLKADDDFLLTPVDDDMEEESDSGSQVIALDTEQFDETADTMLAAGPAVLEEDDFGSPAGDAAMMGGMPGAMPGQPMMQPAAQPEVKYSVWNVLSLMVVMLVMALAGMMMVDLVRNMWQWDQPLAANRPLMDYVLSLLGE